MFPLSDLVYVNCEPMAWRKVPGAERERRHGVTAKLIDYEFTMVPATQFVSGSGIQFGL